MRVDPCSESCDAINDWCEDSKGSGGIFMEKGKPDTDWIPWEGVKEDQWGCGD